MFTVYFDDSGTSPSHEIAIASALVMPSEGIVRLEKEWDRFKAKEGFSVFHAADVATRNPKGKHSAWDDAKRERVFARVRQISKKYGIHPNAAASFAVEKKEYDATVPPKLRNRIGTYHYTFAVQEVLKMLDQWTSRRRVEYLFDWVDPNSESRKELERVLSQRGIHAYTFRPKQDHPGLQCVDEIAWVSYQIALYSFNQQTLHPLAYLAYREYDGDLDEQSWLHAVTIRKRELDIFVADELRKP